jgi:hypothetical protein
MSRSKVTVYDPRVGDCFPGLEDLRARGQAPCVVDCEGVDWQRYASVLELLFAAVPADRFIAFDPWFGWDAERRRLFTAYYPSPVFSRFGFAAAALASQSPGVAACLTLRDHLGGAASGLWALGAGPGTEELLRAAQAGLLTGPALGWLLPLAGAVNVALCLDEANSSTLMVRLDDAVTAAFDRLVLDLRVSAGRIF